MNGRVQVALGEYAGVSDSHFTADATPRRTISGTALR
jgi:hypothetical protein